MLFLQALYHARLVSYWPRPPVLRVTKADFVDDGADLDILCQFSLKLEVAIYKW